jgi:hypothetical protein
MAAITTLDSMQQQVKNTTFSPHGRHMEPSLFIALINNLVITASWACEFTAVHFGGKDDIVPDVAS